MSRRNPGSEAATAVRDARQRLAATLDGAEDQSGDSAGAGSAPGRARGLLQLPEPDGVGFPAADSRHDVALAHRDRPSGNRRAGRSRLSARLRTRTGVQAAASLGVLAAVLGGCFWWQAG